MHAIYTYQVGSELWSGVEQWLEMWAQQQQQMTSGHKPTHHRPSQPHSKTNSTVRGKYTVCTCMIYQHTYSIIPTCVHIYNVYVQDCTDRDTSIFSFFSYRQKSQAEGIHHNIILSFDVYINSTIVTIRQQ